MATIIFLARIGFGIFPSVLGRRDMKKALLGDNYTLSAHARGVLNPICHHL